MLFRARSATSPSILKPCRLLCPPSCFLLSFFFAYLDVFFGAPFELSLLAFPWSAWDPCVCPLSLFDVMFPYVPGRLLMFDGARLFFPYLCSRLKSPPCLGGLSSQDGPLFHPSPVVPGVGSGRYRVSLLFRIWGLPFTFPSLFHFDGPHPISVILIDLWSCGPCASVGHPSFASIWAWIF